MEGRKDPPILEPKEVQALIPEVSLRVIKFIASDRIFTNFTVDSYAMGTRTGKAVIVMDWALNNLTISDLIDSQELLQTFHSFLDGGTTTQQQHLCPHNLSNSEINSTLLSPAQSWPEWRSKDAQHPPTTLFRTDLFYPYAITAANTALREDSSVTPVSKQSISTMKAEAGRDELEQGNDLENEHDRRDVGHDEKSMDIDAAVARPPAFSSSALSSVPSSSSLKATTRKRARALLEDDDDETDNNDAVSKASKSEKDQDQSILTTAKSFFDNRLGSRRGRSQYLVRAIQGFLEADQTPFDDSSDIWSRHGYIFTGWEENVSVARIRRLYKDHRFIKASREEYAYVDRFCYIFLDHDLEQWLKSEELTMSQGRGRMTAAFQRQAEIISSSIEEVRANRKAGRAYLNLLMEGGPGLLLRIGSQVSTIWERKLSKADIPLILEFLRDHLPHIYDTGKALDRFAARALINGFVAHGWNHDEILTTNSELIRKLKHYSSTQEGKTLQGESRNQADALYAISQDLTFNSTETAGKEHVTADSVVSKMYEPSDKIVSPLHPLFSFTRTPWEEFSLMSPSYFDDTEEIYQANMLLDSNIAWL